MCYCLGAPTTSGGGREGVKSSKKSSKIGGPHSFPRKKSWEWRKVFEESSEVRLVRLKCCLSLRTIGVDLEVEFRSCLHFSNTPIQRCLKKSSKKWRTSAAQLRDLEMQMRTWRISRRQVRRQVRRTGDRVVARVDRCMTSIHCSIAMLPVP